MFGNSWVKKEKPLPTIIGLGGGATNLAAASAAVATGPWAGDRGLFGGGYTSTPVNTIDYVSIPTNANASDFGNLSLARGWGGATSGD